MMKPVVDRSLDLLLKAKLSREALKWSLVHVVILGILLYDVSKKCQYTFSKLFYIEYSAIGILSLSLLYYCCRYLYFSVTWKPVVGSADQKRLLQFDDKDNSFVVMKTPATPPQRNRVSLNMSCSFNDSNQLNLSGYSPGNPNQSMPLNRTLNLSNYSPNNNNSMSKPQSTFSSPYLAANALGKDHELFMEPGSLNSLLEDVSYQELINGEEEFSTSLNSMNTFWAHKIDDYAGLLKTSKYQLSPTIVNAKQSNQIIDDCGFFVSAANKSFDGTMTMESSSRLSSAKLSHCVTNLKRWISATVVDRVAKEIESIDSSFKVKGIDIQIGHVGLDRLKKTTENHLVTNNIPTLPLLIPFLELSPNQEYLVNRIKELGKGSCLAEFRHGATTDASGGPWDEHLPTDAAIIFHLFCTYVDLQMLPLPQPGGRPFYDRYVIVGDKKSHSEMIAEVKNKTKCAIVVSNPLKPVFHFISSSKLHESVPDRNNLYHVITKFLIYIKTEHGGYLENVNLDKSGLNILCILDD